MNILDGLAACAGDYRGTNWLQDPQTNSPDDSPATATVTLVLGGRFVRFDYTWGYRGSPQAGSMLFGYDSTTKSITAHWIDSWHMGDKAMACQGPAPGNGVLSVRGSYAAPPDPDWGWRIDVHPMEGRFIRLVMFNISPDGKEELAVEATYTRA